MKICMNNKTLLVNKKTFEWLKEQIPSDISIFNIMKYANQVMNSIKIEIDDTLEDNVVKIKEEEK